MPQHFRSYFYFSKNFIQFLPDFSAAPPLTMRPIITLPSCSLRTVAPKGSHEDFSMRTTLTLDSSITSSKSSTSVLSDLKSELKYSANEIHLNQMIVYKIRSNVDQSKGSIIFTTHLKLYDIIRQEIFLVIHYNKCYIQRHKNQCASDLNYNKSNLNFQVLTLKSQLSFQCKHFSDVPIDEEPFRLRVG